MVRQLENFTRTKNEEVHDIWEKIEDRLRETGKLPSEYNDDDYSLNYNRPTRTLTMLSKEECEKMHGGGLPEPLRQMMAQMGGVAVVGGGAHRKILPPGSSEEKKKETVH